MASDRTDLRQRFKHIVTSEAELRDILGPPHVRAVAKVMTTREVDEAFLARPLRLYNPPSPVPVGDVP